MTTSAARRNAMRTALGVLLAAAVVDGARSAYLLHSDPSPFHSDYRTTAPETQQQVTWRLARSLIALPLAAAGLLLLGGAAVRKPRAGFISAGILTLAGSVHAMLVLTTLPYGFGDGYEHASDTQMLHLKLSYATSNALFVVAIALGAAPFVFAWWRQRVSA